MAQRLNFFLDQFITGLATMSKLKKAYKRNNDNIHMAMVAAAVVLVVYSVVSLVMWNSLNLSYAAIYAITVFILYFIAKRFLGYFRKKKEGVIERKS